jgi:sigma-B regulation protein RsbU (phosphoserine phosphatase)
VDREAVTPALKPGDSITDFITDGSLARLCETLEELIGRPVALRDRIGRVIAASEGQQVWSATDRAALEETADFGGFTAPLRVDGETIGSLALGAREDSLGGEAGSDGVERFLALLASIVSELCEREVALNRQIDRMGALQRIASTLVGAGGLQETINTGLQTAIELLGADAGTLRLLDTSGKVLLPRASFGLSEAYLREAGPLPADNALDREILSGTVLAVSEFPEDDRLKHPQAVRAESLASMLSAALIFQDEPLGVLRVYTRRRREFTSDEQALFRSIARQVAAAVANARLLEREARSAAVREQVRLAGEVQRRMLPRHLPETPPLSFGAVCQSSYDVGGDFYDVFRRGEQIGIVVGDVVGKGVAAALLMANLIGALRAFADRDETPAEVLAATNRALCRDSLASEFATVFLGFADPASRRLVYCNAGHEPPLVARVPEHRAPTRADVDQLDVGGMVIGVDPSQRYQTGVCDLGPGDVLLAFSDGVTEAMDYDLRKFTRERVREEFLAHLGEHPEASARAVCKHMLWAVRRYTGLAEQSDDITITAMRVARG